MANSFAICAPAGNSGKEEISACRIPWIRVYIYTYSPFYFSRERDMNNDPHRSGEKWRYRDGISGNGGGKMMERRCFLGIFIWDRSWHAEAGSNDVQFN